MAVTAFLSMWINNSAATSIMIPAAVAIIDELELHEKEMQEKAANPKPPGNETRRKSKDILPLESTSKNLHIQIISMVNPFHYLQSHLISKQLLKRKECHLQKFQNMPPCIRLNISMGEFFKQLHVI